MKRHLSLALVLVGILVVLAVLVVVARGNGGDSGGDLQSPTLTPSPSQGASTGN